MCGGAAYFVSGAGILITNAVSETVMKTLRFDDGVMTKVFSNALGDKLMICGAVLAVVGAVLIAAFIVVKVTSAKETQKSIKYTAVRKDRRFYSPSAVSCIQYRRRQKGE